jgi:uncharacterized protein YkwD
MSPLTLACLILIGDPTGDAREPLADRSPERARQVAEVTALVNEYRKSKNLVEVKVNAKLTNSADWMARDLSIENYFGHTDSLKRPPAKRAEAFGYKGWTTVCENIAGGTDNPKEAMEMWIDSPGHRKNLENPDVREIGVGYAFSPTSKYKKYWVQIFGARAEWAQGD